MYIFQAECYCDECGEKICAECQANGTAPTDPDDQYSYDSDEYPKSCPDEEETDCPQHCGGCGVPLEYRLTDEGVQYVLEAIRHSIDDALRHGRADTWDRIMPMKGTAEESDGHKYWHGSRYVEIVRNWAKEIDGYGLEFDEAALVSLFLDLSA